MIDDNTDNRDDHLDDPERDNAEQSDNPTDAADEGEQYKVGYGRPPKPHQFPKGRSGNPKGRPKGARGLKTDLKAELTSLVAITENGKTKKITKQQVVLKSLVAKAAKGDTKAAGQVLTMVIQILGIEDERAGRTTLSPSDLAIVESFAPNDAFVPHVLEADTNASDIDNHDNLSNTNLSDEESDDEPSS